MSETDTTLTVGKIYNRCELPAGAVFYHPRMVEADWLTVLKECPQLLYYCVSDSEHPSKPGWDKLIAAHLHKELRTHALKHCDSHDKCIFVGRMKPLEEIPVGERFITHVEGLMVVQKRVTSVTTQNTTTIVATSCVDTGYITHFKGLDLQTLVVHVVDSDAYTPSIPATIKADVSGFTGEWDVF